MLAPAAPPREAGGLLADWVYGQLREAILTRRLAQGAPLSVPALAAELGVSRSPVRESVQRLIAEGLAVHTPHVGASVVTLTARDVADVLAVRELLDGLSAREATVRATSADIDRLTAIVTAQESADPADPRSLAQLDLEFHSAIRALAANAALSDVAARLDTKAHLVTAQLWTSTRHRELAWLEHRSILAAIEAGDASAALTCASAHVAGLSVRVQRWLTDAGRGS